MVKVPCVLCFKMIDMDLKNVLATICDECNTGDMNKVLKNLNYKQVKEAIDKNKSKITLTKDGEII